MIASQLYHLLTVKLRCMVTTREHYFGSNCFVLDIPEGEVHL